MANQLQENVIAPDFELVDTRDQLIRLSDFRGQIVILVLLRGFV